MHACMRKRTKSCSEESPHSVPEVFVAGDDGLLGSITVHGYVYHFLCNLHYLVVYSFFDVNHIPAFSDMYMRKSIKMLYEEA